MTRAPAKPLTLSRDTRFQVQYSTERFVKPLRPFMMQVNESLKSGSSLQRAVESGLVSYPDAAEVFEIGGDGGQFRFGLRDELLLGQWELDAFVIAAGGRHIAARLGGRATRELELLAQFLAAFASGLDEETLEFWRQSSLRNLANFIVANGGLKEGLPVAGSLDDGNCALYRLQHASLYFRSRHTGILVDPHFHSFYDSSAGPSIDYWQFKDKVNAILISHCHEDHFYLSALAMFPKDILIVVPRVEQPTVICPSMAGLLRCFGFTNVVEADWYKTELTIGDIRVRVLPFYGEQPLEADYPRSAIFRNWGNTYLVEMDGLKFWFLIDSGNDPLGTMLDVAERLRETEGSIDVLLSNLRMFELIHPLYINNGLNWLTLTSSQIEEFPTRRDQLTLGTNNVARICSKVGAGCYLPYAHWWGPIGKVGDSGQDTPSQEEEPLLTQLNGDLVRHRAGTQIIPWKIGDTFVPSEYRMIDRSVPRHRTA